LRAALDALRSRGQIKAFARRVEQEPPLRAALEALATAAGHAQAHEWSPKKLVRALRERSAAAQVRRNPIRRDPSFTCAHCGRVVGPGGGRVRDHCPSCLRSLHVDVVPGDRAAGCGGVLDPVSFSLEGRAGVVIHHRCRDCGAERRQRAHPEDQLPPGLDPSLLPEAGSREGRGSGSSRFDRSTLERARTLPARVQEAVRVHRLWEPGERVVLAVSGGLDSTVMMEVLAELGGLGARLEVASVDHGLRPEAVGEVAQVGRQARSLGLPFHSLAVRIEPGPNLAARARAARRTALLALGSDRICTAHHQDDQAETVVQRLLRGAGPEGLAGMAPRRGPWCRPLLSEPRRVLEAVAELRGLRWVEDPSNASSQRGRLRALLPELLAIHGGDGSALARSARLIARENDWMRVQADEAWERLQRDQGQALDRLGLAELHPALQLRVLRRLPGVRAVRSRADQLEPLVSRPLVTGAVHELSGGVRLVIGREAIRVEGPGADPGARGGAAPGRS
jgi:tRNA(Ile)-lysidine synthetase-like protein